MLIPKLIHQTTTSRQMLTEPFKENIEQMKKLHPGWMFAFYDGADRLEFIRKHFDKEMVRTYLSINPKYGPARADLFRYLLLYHCGGVYLDIKSSATICLDSVLQSTDQYLLSHWDNAPGRPFEGWGLRAETPYPGEFQQWHIIAAPRHPFLERVIRSVQMNIHCYNPSLDGTGKRAVLRVTGPIAYTKAIRPLLGQLRSRLVNISDLGLVYSFFDPSNQEFRRSGRLAHEAQMPGHYRSLDEPLVLGA